MVSSNQGQQLQLGNGNGDSSIAISNLLSPTQDQQQQQAPGSGSGSGSESAPPPLSASVPPPPASDTGADAGSEPAVNPRKRKKASRACDFCHVNHQPCDNAKPKCGVCQKHNKPCLYLRPTKRRGPQKGYRTALNTYKESAAAWGAVLGAIPGLDALIEGHLRGSAGKSIISSIKDSNQQDALISRWQDSTVFKAFFGHNGPPPGLAPEGSAPVAQDPEDDDVSGDERSSARPAPSIKSPTTGVSQAGVQRGQLSSIFAMPELKTTPPTQSDFALQRRKDSISLSDIVARDAALGAARASQTLASLGFAPDETIADFYSMGSNPDPVTDTNDHDFDPTLGSESEQRAYYELLMGRSFG
ncbi:hypothetical protein V8F20_007029 [Naviculisporaceae sp. PSN 640]